MDTFGRDWQSLGNGDGWQRVEGWYALPVATEEVRRVTGPVSVLTSLPPPGRPPAEGFATSAAAAAYSALLKQAINVGADWWDQAIEVDAGALGQLGRVVGVPVRLVPEAVAEELETLLGGEAAMGPWPQEPGFGRLYVVPRTGLVYRFDGKAWQRMSPPLAMDSMIGLLANPQLLFDPDAPSEASGKLISCWRLVGGLSPRGAVAGTVAQAPQPPVRLRASDRPETARYLGYYSLTGRAWPTASPAMLAPRRVLPPRLASGVLLADTSRRQAAYLEQTIPAAITRQLRGREVRAQLMARAPVDSNGAATATVALDVEAGSLRQSLSAQVGALPTPVTLNLVIPEDAETITVRVLPTDVSIAVLEGGRAIIDSVTVVPAAWPDTLEAAPLLLRRVRTVTYRPAPRYTRAKLVISERPPDELVAMWGEVSRAPVEQLEKILSGEIEIGMTKRQVRLAWGAPENVSDADLAHWTWSDRAAAFDAEGQLLAWSQQPEHELVRPSICGPAASASE